MPTCYARTDTAVRVNNNRVRPTAEDLPAAAASAHDRQLTRQDGPISADEPGLLAWWSRYVLPWLMIQPGNLAAAECTCADALARSHVPRETRNMAGLAAQINALLLQASYLRDAAAHLQEAVQVAIPAIPAPAAGSPGQLSPRERELVTLVAQGRSDAQIAADLYISIRTVRSHLDRIRDKTGCRRRADLTRMALTTGLL
jgi:DNA-binding CsgD family transcriptional regulator